MIADRSLLRHSVHAAMVLNKILPLQRAEKLHLQREASRPCGWPPIMIIGAPRTGTTVLYQLLLTQCRFAYLCNVDAFWFRAPAMSHRLLTAGGKRRLMHKGLTSQYGYVPGLFSPSEAGSVHANWFEDASNPELPQLAICAISRAEDAPFLAKNTVNSLRLEQIVLTVPQVHFVWVRRAPSAIEASLLRWRERANNRWVGVRPKGYETQLRRPLSDQVQWQRAEIEEAITLQERKTPDRFWQVDYERLCRSPASVLAEISKAYREAAGRPLEFTDVPIPRRLSKSA